MLGILASLLLPVLAKAKARAQSVVCLNNLKQLQLAWLVTKTNRISNVWRRACRFGNESCEA